MRRGASRAVEDFVQAEGDMLDRSEFEAWLDLFTDDSYYWVPLSADQPHPTSGPSHVYDTKDALLARVLRLRDPQNVTQQPPSRCSRVTKASEICARNASSAAVSSPASIAATMAACSD